MRQGGGEQPGAATQRLVASGPMPLAQLAQRARNSKSGGAMLENAVRCLGEAGAALGAAFWLARARERAHLPTPAVREALTALVRRGPSYGAWVALLRASAADVGDAALGPLTSALPDAGPLAALATALEPELRPEGPFGAAADALRDGLRRARRGGVLGFLGFLVEFRNRTFGHGVLLPEAVSRRLAGPFLDATARVLGADALFEGYWLGRVGVVLGGEQPGLQWKRLMGLAEEFLPPAAPGLPPATAVDPGALHFVRGTAALSASFLIAQDEDVTGLSRFGVFQRLVGAPAPARSPVDSARAVQYLDFIGGPFRVDSASADLSDTLAGLAEAVAPSPPDERGPGAASEQPFGDFAIEAELGRGAMGIVYRARQLSLGRTVALKVLPPLLASDPVAMGRFHRESAVLARCDHPNVTRILAHGVAEGRPWYAMEFVEGADLARVYATLRRWRGDGSALSEDHLVAASSCAGSAAGPPAAVGTPDDPPSAPPLGAAHGTLYKAWARLFAQAAQGLAEVHRRGVIHRDVKPGNLMLAAHGDRLVVMDFGLAKTVDQSWALSTQAGDPFVGAARYAAPEQIQARLVPMDHRADVYSLGATLYELVTLAPVYEGDTIEALLQAKLVHQRDPIPPRVREPRVPADLDAIIRRALAREPEARYATADDLAADLTAFAEDRPVSARPPTRLYHLRMFYRRNRALVRTAAVAAVLVVCTAIAAFVAVRGQMLTARDAEVRATVARSLAEQRLAGALVDKALGAEQSAATAEAAVLYATALTSSEDHRARGGANRAAQLARTAYYGSWATDATQAAFSPDGRLLVAGGADGRLRLWDVASRREVASRPAHAGAILGLRFAPAGDRLATAATDRTVKLWRWPLGEDEPVVTLEGAADPGGGAGLPVAFSADGSRLAFRGPEDTAVVWDIARGEAFARQPMGAGVIALSFHPTDGSLFAGVWGSPVLRWTPANGQTTVLGGEWGQQAFRALPVSPGGDRLAVMADDYRVGLLDLASGAVVRTFIGHSDGLASLAFDPSGALLASGASDGSTILWDAERGGRVALLGGVRGQVRSVAFDPRGALLAAAGDQGGVRLWQVRPARQVAGVYPHEGFWVLAAEFSPDMTRLVTAGSDLRFWDLSSGRLERTLPWSRPGWARLAFSPDGAALFIGSGRGGIVTMLDVAGRVEPRVFSGAYEGDNVRAVTASGTGRLVAATARGSVVVWDAQSGAVRARVARPDLVLSAAFRADGALLALAEGDGGVALVDAASFTERTVLRGHGSAEVRDVAFHPAGALLASAGWDGAIVVWDVAAARPAARFAPGQARHCNAVAFRPPTGEWLAAACDEAVLLWDVGTGRLVAEPLRHTKVIENVAFSPDGRWLVSAGDDEVAIVVDLAPLTDPAAELRARAEALCGCHAVGAAIVYD